MEVYLSTYFSVSHAPDARIINFDSEVKADREGPCCSLYPSIRRTRAGWNSDGILGERIPCRPKLPARMHPISHIVGWLHHFIRMIPDPQSEASGCTSSAVHPVLHAARVRSESEPFTSRVTDGRSSSIHPQWPGCWIEEGQGHPPCPHIHLPTCLRRIEQVKAGRPIQPRGRRSILVLHRGRLTQTHARTGFASKGGGA